MDKTVSYSFIQFLFQLVCFFLSVKLINDKAKVDDLITCIRWKNILIWQADCEPVAEFSLKPGVSERLWSKKWVCVGSWIGQRKSPVIVLWCFFLCSCLSASFVWYRKGDVCRGGITVLNSRSCKTQGCHFLQSSLFIYAFLVVWLGLNQILSILLLFFSHPILEWWNRYFSSNLFQPQWGTMSGGVAWLQRGRDEGMSTWQAFDPCIYHDLLSGRAPQKSSLTEVPQFASLCTAKGRMVDGLTLGMGSTILW